MAQTGSGVFEFVFGALQAERDEALKFWAVLGFTPDAEGSMNAGQAREIYGHDAQLVSIRLRHTGCSTFETGLVRLQFWQTLANEGLGNSNPIQIGSRWMGLYTRDILQLRDAFTNAAAMERWGLWVSPLVNAPLQIPAPEQTYYERFVGLRETLVFGNRFRLAFIQRGGFDRPGFGTFDEALPFKNTEGSHANIVQPDNAFSSDFYKRAFDFETAPFGEAHDSGDEPPTIEALRLRPGETFHVERTRAIECPSGLLQIYSSYVAGPDLRDLSRPGCGNLCAYSIRVRDLDILRVVVEETAAAHLHADSVDEFGQRALVFSAPDGYVWIATTDTHAR